MTHKTKNTNMMNLWQGIITPLKIIWKGFLWVLIKVYQFLIKNGKELLFFVVCWFLGIRMLIISYRNIDFTKINQTEPFFLVIIGVSFLLILLPFFKRVKVGDIELEREIKQTQQDFKNFKTETQNSLLTMSNQITSISSINNQSMTVIFPGAEEAKNKVNHFATDQIEQDANKIENDLNMDIVELRVQLEYYLRALLNKCRGVSDANAGGKFMGLYQLTQEFYKAYPDYKILKDSFDYVREVGNAATHAQKIPKYQIKETLEIGSKLIATLKNLFENQNHEE